MSTTSLWSLLLVMTVAAIAPIISRLTPGRPPQVLFLILGGILIGPHVLGFAQSDEIQLIAGLGLGFLFLLAGYELDPALLREKAGKQAVVAWRSAPRSRCWWSAASPPWASSTRSSRSPSG